MTLDKRQCAYEVDMSADQVLAAVLDALALFVAECRVGCVVMRDIAFMVQA